MPPRAQVCNGGDVQILGFNLWLQCPLVARETLKHIFHLEMNTYCVKSWFPII